MGTPKAPPPRPRERRTWQNDDDDDDALLRFAPPRFVVVQTIAKRVLDESVDVVEIDVVIVIAKRLRPVFPTRGVGHEHRQSLRGREKRNHGGISAHESERNGEILQRDAISAISGRFEVFGWTKKNEINNGRWTMFGLLVGMMTEYATGVDFIDQIKLLVNVLGIADLD